LAINARVAIDKIGTLIAVGGVDLLKPSPMWRIESITVNPILNDALTPSAPLNFKY
jgi:hypothetical protein